MNWKYTLLILLSVTALGNSYLYAQCPELVWSDEFNEETLDPANWSHQIGDGCDIDINLCGWGNNELQWYQPQNLTVVDGKAIITAKREITNGKLYSSSRIESKGKVDITFGRIESRIKLPKGQGLWPAFWMLPTDEVYGGWPQSGELDIMEYLGQEEDIVHGTLHFGNAWPNNRSTTQDFQLAQGTFSDEYHDFALEWTNNEIRWYVDGYLYSTKNRSDLVGSRWPFDQDFHFLLNIAVGGNWPGNPSPATMFPQSMEVDYIRVYDMVDQPYLSGKAVVKHQEEDVTYSIKNLKEGSTVTWEVPEDAELMSSENSSSITVNWNTTGGPIKAVITSECGESSYELRVKVEKPLAAESILENFDDAARITLSSSSGVLTQDVMNPAPDEVNSSLLCGKYDRDPSERYDVLFYNITDINDAAPFVSGEKRLAIDLYTDAPIGTNVLIQLENSSKADDTNYPIGRHSRYEITTSIQGAWERLEVPFLDRPDAATNHQSIDQLVILFASNSNDGSSYYFDNFEILSAVTTSTVENYYSVDINPNPIIDLLNINISTGESIDSIHITDSTGKVILSKTEVKNTQINLNLNGLTSGLYFAQIVLNNGDVILERFIKQ